MIESPIAVTQYEACARGIVPEFNSITALIYSASASRQESIRAAVLTQPGVVVTVCAGDRESVVGLLAHDLPQVLIVDLTLPDGESLELVRWVRHCHPGVAILVLALSSRQAHLALAAGAHDAVLHTDRVEHLADAVSGLGGRMHPGADEVA